MSFAVFTILACLGMASAYYPTYPSYGYGSYGYGLPAYSLGSSYGSGYGYYGPYASYGSYKSAIDAPAYSRNAYEDFDYSPRNFARQEYAPAYSRNAYDNYEVAPKSYAREEYAEAPKKTFAAPVAAPVAVETHAAVSHPCPGYYPEIKPIVIKSEKPVPFTYGLPLTPKVIEHHSAPNVLNYYQSPYIVKHQQSAVLHAFTQKPVVVDSYEHPSVYEEYGPQAVIVEEVCPEVPAPHY